MKKIFLAFCLIISTITIQAQMATCCGGELLAMLTEKEVNDNLDGLTQSCQKHSIMSNSNVLETPSKKNISYIKFKVKNRKHLFGNFIANSSILFALQFRQTKHFSLNVKTIISEHSKVLEILNEGIYNKPTTNEHLCLNIPQSSNYKISVLQGDVMLKGTVQDEAINIGRLPQEVYLLDAWSLGDYQKEKPVQK
jgi:hypothetical protein